ncbi:unnamed protein product [Timema podura]|uniref:V-SNARE coiled-coil homology domain-containing protein n=1 Tax=Timema podura TaxID=61482 RepID=A0ABN7NEU8_TIMPD|nr:unnamed protein product [Timema podura]
MGVNLIRRPYYRRVAPEPLTCRMWSANLFFVVDIMKTNVEKVLERDQKLSELDDRAVIAHLVIQHNLCYAHVRTQPLFTTLTRTRLIHVYTPPSHALTVLSLACNHQSRQPHAISFSIGRQTDRQTDRQTARQLDMVTERNVKFTLLDALQQGASQFEQQAGKLKRKFWLQNLKSKTFYLHMIKHKDIGYIVVVVIVTFLSL